MQPTGFLYHPDYLKHETGFGHPESPARLTSIVRHLETNGLMSELYIIEPKLADIRWIETIHSPAYRTSLEFACRNGVKYLDSDTGICPDSYRIARLAVGGALAAVDAVMANRVQNAFCAIRPPGHHAVHDRAMGFCLFNNIAITARYIQQTCRLRRILIIDWDVHHGNGTQDAFYDDPSVFYFSIHQYPYYPGSGSKEERGQGEGMGMTMNFPLNQGADDEDYFKIFQEELLPAATQFAPEFVLISAGFDAHQSDPLAGMNLTDNGYAQLTAIIKKFALAQCQGRIVSLLEGGYDPDALATCVEAHIRALID